MAKTKPAANARKAAHSNELKIAADLPPGETPEQRITRLEAELAELKGPEPVTTETADSSQQPSPSDVSAGKVWNGSRFVDYDGGPQFIYRVESPQPFSGTRGGVRFRDGVGGTDDADLAWWFINTLKYSVFPLPVMPEEATENIAESDASEVVDKKKDEA